MSAYYLSRPGIVCPLGNDLETVASNLFAGFADGLQRSADFLPDRAPYCGVVHGDLLPVPDAFAAYRCRNNQLQLTALAQIRADVDAAIARFGPERVAVIIGSSTSGIGEGGAAIKQKLLTGKFPEDYAYSQQEIGTPSEFLADYLGLCGIRYTVSTACTSSTKALVSARNLLQADLADAVIVGGADSLCALTVGGFAALESVSADKCAPFSAQRDGINIGEGAALMVLSKTPLASVESASTHVQLLGVGESSDAYHISAPQPDGIGAEQAIRAALDDAGIGANAIGYINLHGTATRKNDEMEARAVSRVFAATTPCSSTKAMTGHLLGAAGACEIVFCWLTLMRDDGLLPPQLGGGIENYDAQLPVLALVSPPSLTAKKSADKPGAPRYVMTTNYAFGGSNAALVLARSDVALIDTQNEKHA